MGSAVSASPVLPMDSAAESRLGTFVFPTVVFADASLPEGMEYFSFKSRDLDPAKKGISFMANEDVRSLATKITFDLHNIKLSDVVRYTAMIARLQVTLDGDAVFLEKSQEVRPPFAAQKASLRCQRHADVVLPSVRFSGASLSEAAEYFRYKTKDIDAMHELAHIIIDPDLLATNPKITMDLKDVTLSAASRYACRLANAEVICIGDAFYWQPAAASR